MATLSAWTEVYEELHDRELSALAPEQLESLADAAWWTSRVDEAIGVRQKAYAAYARAGNARRAGYSAWFLFWDYVFRGEPSVAHGWLRRAERHLAAEPDCIERAYLDFALGELALWKGDGDEALAAAERVVAAGLRLGSADLVALGTECAGRARIARGGITEGVADLDEAMCSVIAGELSPLFTGWIYCHVLVACWELTDLRRAAEWTDAALRWCDDLPDTEAPFRGLCRIHRVEMATLRGDWAVAAAEAQRTCDELLRYEPHAAGMAFEAAGEVHRRRGDHDLAEAAFTRAIELGHEPQPGLALLQHARGRTQTAAAGLARALAGPARAGYGRARLLAAQVELSLACGDLETAGAAAADLQALAGRLRTPALQAAAFGASGALRLAEGDAAGAVASLRAALSGWQELEAPYEAARTRELLAAAASHTGDGDGARLELEVADAVYRRLGATEDARRTALALGLGETSPAGLTPREMEVLRLLARGKTNREIAAELVISGHTVARHLNNIYAKLAVSTRAAATAYAFTHGLAP